MKRRIIAALMCLCMLIGLLPVSVLAAHSESPTHLFELEYDNGGTELLQGTLNVIVQDESGNQLDQMTVTDYYKTWAAQDQIKLISDKYVIIGLSQKENNVGSVLVVNHNDGRSCTFSYTFTESEETLVMTVREFNGPEVDEEINTGATIEYRIYDAQLLKMLYAAGCTNVDIDTDIETIEFEFIRDYTGSSDWEFLYKLPVANSLGYHYASLSDMAGNGNPYNIEQLTITFNNGVKAKIPASDLLYHKAGDLLYEIKANAEKAKDLCAVVFYAQPGVLVEYHPYAIRFVEKNESFQSAGIDMPEVPDYGAEYIFTNWAYDTEGERPFLKSDVIVGDTDVYARRTSSSLGGSEIHVMNRTDSLVNRFLELYNAQQSTAATKDDIDFSSVQITVYGKDGAHTNPDYDNGVTQCEWKNDNEYFFVVNYNTPYGIPALTNTHIPHDEISKIVMTAKVNGQDAQVEMSVGDGAGELSVNLNVQEYIIELVVNDAPDAPDDEDLTGDPDDPTDLGILGNVKIKCTNPDATHNNKEKEYKAVVGSYTIGPVISTADGGYKCDVTVAAEKYVAQYNTDLGVSHTAQYPTAKKITLTWNDDANEWIAPSGLPVEFSVNCSQDKYTLTYDAGTGTFDNGQDTYVVDGIPATEDYLLGSEAGFNNPSHAKEGDEAVVLAGWSITQPTGIYSKESSEVPVLTKVIDINSTTATNKAVTVYAVWSYDENDNGVADAYEITIAPAGMTVYMGGEGYEGTVVDDEGNMIGEDTPNGFPEVGFTVTFPESLKNADITDLKLQYKGEDGSVVYQWGFESYDGSTTAVYRIVPEGETATRPIRMEFTKTTEDGEELVISDSTFNPSLNLNQTLTLKVYGEGIEEHLVSFAYNNQEYGVSVGTSVLTVRGTTNAVLYSNDPAEAGVTLPVLEAGEGTSYKINNSSILVRNDADGSNDVALLFDDIIDGNAADANYTELLKAKTDAEVGAVAPGDIRNYQYKYLDLVDTANGNAWVTPSGAVTIKWPLPAGTSASTEFTLLHFEGVNRSMTPTAVTEALTAASYQPTEVQNVEVENGYVVFQTNSFSPFVLTWDSKAPVTNVTVTFNAGAHGTLSGDSTTTVAQGGKLTSDQIPSVSADTNYTFTGWESSVDGKVYTNDALLTLAIGQATTFTARYEYHDPGQGGIQYDHHLYYHSNFGKDQQANEGTDDDEVVVKDYDELKILPERDGYVFVSWNTEEDGSGTRYLPGDVFDLTKSEHHLYAQWQKDKTGPDDSGVSNWLETDEHNAYLSGYPDSTFRADRNMTRAEVAQMFYALLLDKDVTITKSFSDVPDDAWYATAVKTLASLGMMDGYPDGTFRPDEPITRAEFATVGLAFAYDPIDADCSYYDVSASAWYHTYVAQATTYGWIGGYPDNTFRPGNNITRVEVCVIVNNMLGRDADERYIDRHEDELVHFVDLSDSYWGYYTIMEATNTHEYTGSFTNEKWTDVK